MRLNLKRFTALLIVTLSLTACQSVNEQEETQPEATTEEQIKARALQDEFTRSMLKSAQETEKGYYTLESKTGEYEMLFPAGGEISSGSYTNNQGVNEAFMAGVLYEDKTQARIKVQFNQKQSNDETGIQYAQKFLKKNLGIEDEFKNIEKNGNTFYLAPFQSENGYYGYGAYIYDTSRDVGGIEFIYTTECRESFSPCSPSNQEVMKKVEKVLSSVEFKK
ncbi:hypothetical protein NIZ91_11430 [Bacillus sp. 1780r2a1]|uniref:hypothetical protein n=1 Tax=Priestia flexa TaxID=86664 RepID=UPI002206B349|nr:hypothetical protein [Priestia flexa]MDT2046624.1 hypothetical protein [Priestia flexa]USY53370.1 hypothetical protein NIZ91_11430 [Bacillus sp. 1780r2a1]